MNPNKMGGPQRKVCPGKGARVQARKCVQKPNYTDWTKMAGARDRLPFVGVKAQESEL